ncbi:disease resistance RPP13 1 [Olea europaea subsp. europaea]|uniref:Disease resistance RPP13 1 n=1 Tax=Olea europaea subsp. europaea TaxID=158383 RepID=A0A8S0PK90_OLEEU|nr:disease resistance RPP13 1 [Olea europaea subsp. europaea]
MAIVEVFLGAFLTVLLEKLASRELLKFLCRAVLTDAENKQTTNRAVNQWLNDLEDLAYDLDVLVDELNTIASLRKLKENKGSTSKLVYNDERLKHKFDLKAWVCVKDNFNAFKVTKCVLESVSSGKSDYRNFNMLQVTLKENLSNKKFLVVLDDIWNENYGDWDILRRPFLSGKSGSKIIITTRQEGVAKIMSHILAYHVTELSEDDAVSLLVQQAFGGKNIDANLDLRDNCKSVVRRCKNLPLAVKALQGLLRTKGPKEWEEVLESKIWMADEKSEILSALKLSY